MKPFSTINAFKPPLARSRHTPQRPLYDDANEREKHRRHIESLATEMQTAVDELVPLYEAVLARMKEKAVVTDFLPILVSKRVKYLFQN